MRSATTSDDEAAEEHTRENDTLSARQRQAAGDRLAERGARLYLETMEDVNVTQLSAMRETAQRLCVVAEQGEISVLRDCLAGQSNLRQRFLARLLGYLAERNAGAVRVLEALLDSNCDDVRAEAYDALARCPARVLATVIERMSRLREPEPWVEVSRIRALSCAAAHEPDAVVKALRIAAETTQEWVQVEVFDCLGTCLRVGSHETLDEVERWFLSPSADVRETALLWMGSLREPPVRRLLRAAVRLSDDCSPLVRAAAARVLSRYSMRDPESVLPALTALARDRAHHLSRLEVAYGLLHWQADAPFEALMILKSLLEDSVPVVRRVAMRQLFRLSKEHPALALGVVREWHELRQVRRHAVATCMRGVTTSSDPEMVAQASRLLDEIGRRWARRRGGTSRQGAAI